MLLDTKGHVLADLDLWMVEDEILLLGDHEPLEVAVDVLRRYVLRSEVSITDVSNDSGVLRVCEGGEAMLGIEPPRDGVSRHRIAGADVLGARGGRLPGTDLLIRAADAERVVQWLLGRGVSRGDPASWDRLRVQLGIPAPGAELTGAELPQEARLDVALDYDKGCYPGQETVARIHYRGHVNRLLCGLLSTAPLRPRDVLSHDGRQVGAVTSAVAGNGQTVALGYVRREQAERGATLQAPGGAAVEIRDLPHVPAVG